MGLSRKRRSEEFRKRGLSGASIPKIIEKLGNKIGVGMIKQSDYVYYDEKVNRYRAGVLSKKPTGQFVSSRSAGGLKSAYTRLKNRLGKARAFQRQKGLTGLESWKKSEEWLETYRDGKEEIGYYQDLSAWVDAQYSLSES